MCTAIVFRELACSIIRQLDLAYRREFLAEPTFNESPGTHLLRLIHRARKILAFETTASRLRA
jgi:hypothetical protein